MRRILFVAAAVGLLVPSLLGSATSAVGITFPKFLMKPSGTVTVDPAAFKGIPNAGPKAAISPTPHTNGCSDHSAHNVRANQECTNQSAPGYFGRGQSQNETAVAVNPTNPDNVLISQNDYRRGDAGCGADFSYDGGTRWGSELAPHGFARAVFDNGGARHYWDAGGDTSVAFDSTGEAYLMCQVFNRPFPTSDQGDQAPFGPSAFLIFRSHDGGASWSFPGDYVVSTTGPANGGLGLLDKEYMTIDNNPNSPYADRIYVSWTNYPADFSTAPIYFAYSTDHGVTWHQSGMINGSSESLCPVAFGTDPAGTCNNSQFSQPFVSPSGDVYVVFANFNNCNGAFSQCEAPSNDNHSQILVVKSEDGGNSFGKPVKVSDYYDLPDCAAYAGDDAGRSCVPTAPLSTRSVFRAANYPSGVALDDDNIRVTFGSEINEHSRVRNAVGEGHCRPQGFSGFGLPLYNGVGDVNGCNNDIVLASSSNGGASFDGTTTPVSKLPSVNDEGSVLADQWFQWSALSPANELVTSYYDRRYGPDQSNGNMDFSLVVGTGPSVRVTDKSMPPSNEFPGASGFSVFMGDYTGIAVGSDGVAHPAWEDTRNPIYTFDSTADARNLIFAGFGGDIYTAAVPISDGG